MGAMLANSQSGDKKYSLRQAGEEMKPSLKENFGIAN
jgi:hypothetical protein